MKFLTELIILITLKQLSCYVLDGQDSSLGNGSTNIVKNEGMVESHSPNSGVPLSNQTRLDNSVEKKCIEDRNTPKAQNYSEADGELIKQLQDQIRSLTSKVIKLEDALKKVTNDTVEDELRPVTMVSLQTSDQITHSPKWEPGLTTQIESTNQTDEQYSAQNTEFLKQLLQLMQSQNNQIEILKNATKKIDSENGEDVIRSVTMHAANIPQQATQCPRCTNATESTNQKTQAQQWAWHIESTTVPPVVTSTETPNVYQHRPHNLRCSRDYGCFKQTGYGYDAFLDEILESTPLTPYGDRLCKYLPMDQPNPYVPHYVLKQFDLEYFYNRQGQPKVKIEHTTNPGVDKNLQSRQNIYQKLSIIIEFRTFKNELTLGCSAVKQEFTNFVYDLPTYRRTSCYAVSKWRELFARYGTHLVNSSYVGGAIEILPGFKLMNYIRQNYPDYGNEVEKNKFFHNIHWDQMEFEIISSGGGNNSFLNKSDVFSHQTLRTWKDSLLRRGVPLETDFTTVPIVSLLSSIPYYLSLVTSYSYALKDYKDGYFHKYCNYASHRSCQTKKLEGSRVTLFDSKCFLEPWVTCRDNLSKIQRTHFCGKNLSCVLLNYAYVCDCDIGFTLNKINSTNTYACNRINI